jgi:hypothetical protein
LPRHAGGVKPTGTAATCKLQGPGALEDGEVLKWFAMRAHGSWALGLLVCAVAVSGCAGQQAQRFARPEPLPPIAPRELVAEAEVRAEGGCRLQLRHQLRTGVRLLGDCDATESRAARQVVFAHGVRFGVVDHRRVDLAKVRMRLSEAMLCKGWPLTEVAGQVLHPTDAQRAGCVLRPYRGKVTVTAVSNAGTRRPVLELQADRDGAVAFEFSEADAALRADTDLGLDAYARLEIGASAWAGAVDLVKLREFLADWHFAWVSRGRGSAALFAKRHGEHPRRADAEAFAIEARVVRQEEDFHAVAEGRMEPVSFLQRHVWSPFRRAVQALLEGESGSSSGSS